MSLHESAEWFFLAGGVIYLLLCRINCSTYGVRNWFRK